MSNGTSATAAGYISPPASPLPALPATGITVFGCRPEEAALFRELAPRFGVEPTITGAPLGADNVALAAGNRCVSIAHKPRVENSTLLALRQAGVRHVLTRSVGTDHLDARHAKSVGISVAPVSYSPDSVADYTLMLILMALRSAKAMVRRADVLDYRLPAARGKELRDLTVGVVGTGRIGTAVIERLRGFGCRVVANNRHPGTAAGWLPLDDLLHESDVVTLHTPLTADTRHLLDRRRIERMKPGAFLVNTGRGALIDTRALVRALECGRLAGAALDVVEGEEGVFYEDCSGKAVGNALLLRLQELPNALISPHSAYYTDHALRDLVENTLLGWLSFEARWRDA